MTRAETTYPDDEVSVREAARILRVHENTVRNMVKDGRLTPKRRLPVSRYMRFDRIKLTMMAQEARNGR